MSESQAVVNGVLPQHIEGVDITTSDPTPEEPKEKKPKKPKSLDPTMVEGAKWMDRKGRTWTFTRKGKGGIWFRDWSDSIYFAPTEDIQKFGLRPYGSIDTLIANLIANGTVMSTRIPGLDHCIVSVAYLPGSHVARPCYDWSLVVAAAMEAGWDPNAVMNPEYYANAQSEVPVFLYG
jgi:hypothetical protein